MKAITLWQPYASLVVWGEKEYETRSWGTAYRGELAIHAGKRLLTWNDEQILLSMHPWLRDALARHGVTKVVSMPLGAMLGVVTLEGVFRTEDVADHVSRKELEMGDFSRGRYAWQCVKARALTEPIPALGSQGLWEWDAPAALEYVE